MLKRISVQQLVLGMHIKEFCGSWMEHPFWRSGFVLSEPTDLQSILASSIQEVWIDVAKGLDVAPGQSAACAAQAQAEVDEELTRVEAAPSGSGPVPAAVEMQQAAQICLKSKQAVMSMFQEARMGKAVDSGQAQQLVAEISDSLARNAHALISLARLKTADDYTYMHSVAVSAMMIALARQLGFEEDMVRSAGLAGLLHDLGKAAMPMDVLNKPGKLTDAEFAIMKSHPVQGHKMLQASGQVDAVVLDVCLHHHEKVDGSGYPKGLQGFDISLLAKMGAVCDVYDAITSNRPYKAGWDPAESLRKMAEWAKGHFDQRVFQAFVKSIGIYPIGSLVRLSSGRIGVVVDQGNGSLTRPVVKVFYSTIAQQRITPEVIDLSAAECADKITGLEDPAQWSFPDLDELWAGAATAVR